MSKLHIFVISILLIALIVTTGLLLKVETSGEILGLFQQDQSSEDVLSQLRKHIFFESDDHPVVSTIEDKVEELIAKNPTFYKNVQIGDALIVFDDRIVLFRPSADLVVNMSLLN